MVCHAQSATYIPPRSKLPPRPPAELTVEGAIGLFLDSLFSRGARETTLISRGNLLRRFFRPALNEPLSRLSPERLLELSEELNATTSRKTGDSLLKRTLLAYHGTARMFTRWCVAQGRLPADPMAGMRTKTTLQLHEEVNKLRVAIETMRRQCDRARQQLSDANGGAL